MADELKLEPQPTVAKMMGLPVKYVIILVVISGIILALVGFLVGTLKSNTQTSQTPSKSQIDVDTKKDKKETEKSAETFPFPLDTFYANLADKDETRYLKITISLELSNQLGEEPSKKYLPKIRDCILSILSSKSVDDVSSIKGKEFLKNQLKTQLNTFIKEDTTVKDVYFTEFIIQ
jgi:flagellar protein FliL